VIRKLLTERTAACSLLRASTHAEAMAGRVALGPYRRSARTISTIITMRTTVPMPIYTVEPPSRASGCSLLHYPREAA
jgi:hypothetical protein